MVVFVCVYGMYMYIYICECVWMSECECVSACMCEWCECVSLCMCICVSVYGWESGVKCVVCVHFSVCIQSVSGVSVYVLCVSVGPSVYACVYLCVCLWCLCVVWVTVCLCVCGGVYMCVSDMSECVSVGMCVYVCVCCMCLCDWVCVSVGMWTCVCVSVCVVATLTHMSFKIHILCTSVCACTDMHLRMTFPHLTMHTISQLAGYNEVLYIYIYIYVCTCMSLMRAHFTWVCESSY